MCMAYMLDNEISYDTVFKLGKLEDEVRAHRILLVCRSPVFFAMLEGPLAEKGPVKIPDIEKDIFLHFLR